jgi:hypothetical protein
MANERENRDQHRAPAQPVRNDGGDKLPMPQPDPQHDSRITRSQNDSGTERQRSGGNG